jgi:hypothetical protein
LANVAATAGEFSTTRAERYDEQARLGLPGYEALLGVGAFDLSTHDYSSICADLAIQVAGARSLWARWKGSKRIGEFASMSRAVPDVPSSSGSRGDKGVSVHRSQADVISEQEMHAEHVAALDGTLFCMSRPTLVLSLESGSFRVLAESAKSPAGREGDR